MLPQILLLPTSIVIKNIHNCKTENLAMTLFTIIDYQSNFQLRVLKHSVPKTTYKIRQRIPTMHTQLLSHTHMHSRGKMISYGVSIKFILQNNITTTRFFH